MNGVARLVATSSPLIAPMSVPAPSPEATPIVTEPVLKITIAVTSPATDKAAPTERSSPPAMSSMVCPVATMPSVETWNRILRRLPADRKRGLPTAVTITTATSVMRSA